uniref:Uncharacterized protein n=1 Tax=Candidatus Kentrum sp. FM TaxID=2126340 RepID=A0A450SAL6_9GAMM|nr:MAG: hypothetical protein BECKFM1743C_GA0114222_100674 [Candidatus Kentron sp. FM]
MRSEARHYIPPNRVRYPTDCLFASGCSPPHLTVTQLPSASESWHTPVGDFHPADESPSRAHDRRVVLGILSLWDIFAEYNSAIPGHPKRIRKELNSPGWEGEAPAEPCRRLQPGAGIFGSESPRPPVEACEKSHFGSHPPGRNGLLFPEVPHTFL